jgi:hypothetical protein
MFAVVVCVDVDVDVDVEQKASAERLLVVAARHRRQEVASMRIPTKSLIVVVMVRMFRMKLRSRSTEDGSDIVLLVALVYARNRRSQSPWSTVNTIRSSRG